MSGTKMDFSNTFILIPAFNEEKNLLRVVNQLKRAGFNGSHLVLADDGSRDQTVQIGKDLGIRIIRSPINQGKGYILYHAFDTILNRFPSIKCIMTIDGDGQHDHREIPQFMKAINKGDSIGIVIGRRDFNIMPHINKISNRLTSLWCLYWLQWDVPDVQCGFRAYRSSILRQILNYGISTKKFDFETELLFITWLLGFDISSIPIRTVYIQNNRESYIAPITDTLRWIRLAFRFGFNPLFMSKIWQQRLISKKRNR
ncbi:MAG: glycosyltransferase family 2 protein [Candidatus Thorarchaeota archaeon]